MIRITRQVQLAMSVILYNS